MHLRPTHACALAAIGCLSLACSDDPRVPQGARFSSQVIDQPGVVLIDDMEDRTQYILSDDGLNGLWYVYNDESGGSTQTPEVGFPMTPNNGNVAPIRPCAPASPAFFATEAEGDCDFFAHTTGSGHGVWGAGIGVDLNGDGGQKNSIDATIYGGIGFFARGNLGGNALRVKVQDVSNTPESAAEARRMEINRCDPDDTGALQCSNPFGITFEVTNDWQWYQFTWSQMSTEGYAAFVDSGYTALEGFAPPGFHVEAIVGLQFQVPVGASAGFDFSVDNVSFLERSLIDGQ